MPSISGNIYENLDITDWRVTAVRCKDGTVSGTSLHSGTTYSVTCADAEPCNVTISPKIDYKWSASRTAAVGDYVIATNPDAVPGLWKCTASAGAGDLNFPSVSLLVQCDGTVGGGTFTDISPTPKTLTNTGTVISSTAAAGFGQSAYFDGTARITSPSHANFDMGTGAFTLELFVYYTAGANQQGLLAFRDGSTSTNQSSFYISVDYPSTGKARAGVTIGGASYEINTTDVVFANNTWTHVAFIRDGASLNLFVGGVSVGTASCSSAALDYNAAWSLNIGRFYATGLIGNNAQFTGYLDSIRITKGVARYTANFTPPSAPFPESAGGSTGTTEPTWNMTGTTADNNLTWTFISNLVDPVTIGPKVPV